MAFVLREIIFYKNGSARVSNWPANLTGQTTLGTAGTAGRRAEIRARLVLPLLAVNSNRQI